MKKFVKKILLIINIILALLSLLSYLSIYISPNSFYIMPFLGLAYPFIILINIIFILFWLIVFSRYFLISLVTLLIGWNSLGKYFQFSGKENTEKGIKVLSYNVQHFNSRYNNTEKENVKEITEFLKQQQADIICLQEVRLRKNKIFNIEKTMKKLGNIKHYQYARTSPTYGSTTLTRYPIVNMQEIRFKGTRNMSICTDVVINKDTVRIFNIHLQSYRINPKDYPNIEASSDLRSDETREQVKELGNKLRYGFQKRAKQAEIIKKEIEKSPYPVIVCGDFNDTPSSYSYHQIKNNLKDAFMQSGKGFGKTYIGKYPSFRIDYIFYSNDFESYNFKTLNFKKSDHLPITTDLLKID